MPRTAASSTEDAGSSRSNGSRRHPAAQYIRFTDEENNRISRAARKLGRTMQSFLHDAGIAALEAHEGGRPTPTYTATPAPTPSAAPRSALVPRGMGLREKLDLLGPPPVPEPEDPRPRWNQQPQVVINNVPPSPAAGSTLPDHLAAFVIKGPPESRDDRVRTCAQIIAASVADEAERTRLAKALDARVAELLPTAPKSKSPLSFISDFLAI